MLLKRIFKVQRSHVLILFENGDNKTILKNLEQQFMSVINKLKPKLCTTYIELWKNFGRRVDKADRNGYFHLILIRPS